MKKTAQVLLVLFLFISVDEAFAQAVFESISQYNLPSASVTDLCTGIRTGASSNYHCNTLVTNPGTTNDAKQACDGIFWGISRLYACNQLDPKTQKSSRDICDGLFWGSMSQYSCNQLNPKNPKPTPDDYLAKESCDAMFWAKFPQNSCGNLSNQRPQVMALCNRIHSWTPATAMCK
jgi:hypothetical protein